jgi:hypothetical protein
MSEKMFNTRIIHKHDTQVNWEKATGFVPKIGELIVYDPDENFGYARMKMGDGVTNVNDLPFVVDIATDEEIIEMLGAENIDMLPAVTDADGAMLTDENDNILMW